MASTEERALKSVKHLVDMGLHDLPEAFIRPENERPTATPIYTENFPVIDLQGLNGPKRPELVNAISKVCQEWGFFQVINHGVPERVIERMVKAHHRFFEQPEEEKAKYKTGDNPKHVVYATSFPSKDEKGLQWRDYLAFTADDQSVEYWPPVIRDAAVEYVTEVRRVAINLLSALSESLGIPYVLENLMGSGRLLLNYYSPCPNPDMTFGVSGHSDLGLITVLLQDDVGGLQVLHNGRWVAVQPISNAFVVNVADSLEILSNGKFHSAEHRAVASQSRVRISIPLFCDPDSSTVISPIPELVNDNNPAKYNSITYGEYLEHFRSRPISGKADNLAFARIG